MSIEGNHRTVIGIAALVWGMAAVAQAPFAVDTTFRAYPSTWYVSDVLPQEDGKVIISGQIRYPGSPIPTAFAGLARLNADGSWDDSFPWSSLGQGKMVPWEDRFYIATIQTVRRVLYTGQNDGTFIGMNLDPYFSSLQGGDYHVFPDGRLVMSGLHTLSDTARGFVGYHNFIWFSNTGHLDTTRTHRKGNGKLSTFLKLPDGKFIASGTCTVYDGRPTSWIQRMHPDGSLDTTFFSGVNWGRAYAYLPLEDGRVYAGGVFRKADAPQDTLRLVRLLTDGGLDLTYTMPVFELGDIPYTGVGAQVHDLYALDENLMIVTGTFQYVNGEPRRGICVIDSTGQLQSVLQDQGVDYYTFMGIPYGGLMGIKPSVDGDQWWVWGSYQGFADGMINDPAQRFVTRLHGGDLNLSVTERPVFIRSLRLHPNPTQAWVAVDYELQPNATTGQLLVKDGTGRVLHSQALAAPRGQVVLDTRPWAKGLYTLELLQDGMRTQLEKLLVQ